MALAFTKTRSDVVGTKRVVYGTLAFDSSYPTGGESITLAGTTGTTGLRRVDSVTVKFNSGYLFTYTPTDSVSGKVLAYQGDNTNAAAAPLIQVANTTDLSALTAVPIEITGV